MHETRKGEMARVREIPFGRYYGGVDTTPLFVMLGRRISETNQRRALRAELWPAVREPRSNWIETFGDADGDGFVEYRRGAEAAGCNNQGWKDFRRARSSTPTAAWREAPSPWSRCRPMSSRQARAAAEIAARARRDRKPRRTSAQKGGRDWQLALDEPLLVRGSRHLRAGA